MMITFEAPLLKRVQWQKRRWIAAASLFSSFYCKLQKKKREKSIGSGTSQGRRASSDEQLKRISIRSPTCFPHLLLLLLLLIKEAEKEDEEEARKHEKSLLLFFLLFFSSMGNNRQREGHGPTGTEFTVRRVDVIQSEEAIRLRRATCVMLLLPPPPCTCPVGHRGGGYSASACSFSFGLVPLHSIPPCPFYTTEHK